MLLQYSAKLQKFCVPSVHGFVRSIALSAENSLQDTLRYVSSLSTSELFFLPLCFSFYLCATLSTSVLFFLLMCYSFYLCAALSASVLLFMPLCCSLCLCAALSTSVLLFLSLCCSFYLCDTLSTSVLLPVVWLMESVSCGPFLPFFFYRV